MTKGLKSKVKMVTKETKLFVKKTNVKIGKTAKSIQKKWKAEKPKRDKIKKELIATASKMFSNGLMIGEDVVKVIKKDIKEINSK